MQRLTASPREGLTESQVRALLVSDSVVVSGGVRLLDGLLRPVADISDDLLEGKVERNCYARIHGRCSLKLSRALSWGTDLLQPYVDLTDRVTGVTARFHLGVFSLITPDRQIGETPETYDVSGLDRIYLLDRQVGDTYSVGTIPVLQAVRAAFTAAGFPTSQVLLDGTASDVVLPGAMTWPLLGEGGSGPTTWLRIINDLLQVINYRGIYCDENGLFRSEPYAAPTDRGVEWAFDADESRTVVLADRTVVQDLWRVPNRWVFVRRNMEGSPPAEPVSGAGLYEVSNVNGLVLGRRSPVSDLTSQQARGLTWTETVQYDAASQDALVALGLRRVEADLRGARELRIGTGPFPLAGHFDVFTYRDGLVDGGSLLRVQARAWSLDLIGDSVQWELEVVA